MNKKMMFKIIPVIFIFCIILTNVFGFGNKFDPSVVPDGNDVVQIKQPVEKIWNTVSLVLQVCAVAGIIFAGIRYMFAGADAKSELKKSLPYLITGLVIVFASPYVIGFVVEIVEEVTK